MSFLQSLRMASIFPRNRGQDRPFGMPEIESGNIGSTLNQVIPLAESMRRNRMRDEANMASSYKGPEIRTGPMAQQPNRLQQISDQLRTSKPQNVVYGGELGPTSTQRDFMKQSDIQRGVDLEDKNFRRAAAREDDISFEKKRQDDVDYMRKSGDEKEAFSREADLERETSKTKFDRDLHLEKYRDQSAMGRTMYDVDARERAAAKSHERATELERVKGEEDRKTWDVRGKLQKDMLPTQQTRDFANRVQDFVLKFPRAAEFIEKDPETGNFRISDRATPEQADMIRQYLAGDEQASPDNSSSQVMKRRNKRDGRIQTSTDGGKTWSDSK